jgi:hypothetical protein
MFGDRVLADLMPTGHADITGRIGAAVKLPLAETGSKRWSLTLVENPHSMGCSVV